MQPQTLGERFAQRAVADCGRSSVAATAAARSRYTAAAPSSSGIAASLKSAFSVSTVSFFGIGVARLSTVTPTGASLTCSSVTSVNHALPVVSDP